MSESVPSMSSFGASQDEAARPSSARSLPAEAQLDDALQTLRHQVEERLRALIDSIEDDLFTPLQSAAHESAAIHAALVKTSNFERSVEEIDATLRWERVRDYRRDTLARVIKPLQHKLVEVEVGTTLKERWTAFWDDLASTPSTLPVSITRPEPGSLYAPAATDTTLVALRKRWVRTRRRLQPTSALAGTSSHSQEIPLRLLAAYHLRMRLPNRLAPHETAIYQRFAQAVASFERAVTTWTHRLLDAERHLRPPPGDRWDEAGRGASEAVEDPVDDASARSPAADTLPPTEVWATVGAEAKLLDEQLHALASFDFEECPARVRDAVQQAWSALRTDVDHADSFLLDPDDRSVSPSAPHDQRNTDIATRWSDWHHQAAERLAFCETLAALRDTCYESEEALVSALAATSVHAVRTLHTDAAERLHDLHDEARRLFSDADRTPEALAEALRSILARALRVVEEDLVEPLQKARLRGSIDEQLRTPPVSLDAFFETHPAAFQLHALAPPGAESISPDADARTVDLHAIAREHFDSFFAEALRERLRPFHERLETILAGTKETPGILQFNLEAACEELSDVPDAKTDEVIPAARELALNGLARSVESIDSQVQHIRASFSLLSAAIAEPFAQAWVALHDRARVEGRIREHLLELRTLVNRETQEATERAERRFRAARIRLKRAFRLGRGRAEELVQIGRSAVGATAFSEDSFLETLEALASIDYILADLPLVYRRLFSFQPVTDPSLLAGRHQSLTRLQRHVDQWQRGLSNALIITGHYGSGLTSFLNVVQRTSLSAGEVHWLTLDDRLRSESAVAERVVRALDLPLSPRDGAFSLNQVREYVLDQPRPDAPRACIVEHMEHLLLRTVRGTELVTRVLTFMSRTDSRILWLGTLSEHSWQLLDRAESAAAGLALHHRLAPIDRSALEELILLRHQRSGLRLQFDEPDEPSPILRQRLRKAATDATKQNILQQEHFDRLYTQCGSNIMLALFHWVRSVQLDEQEMVMHVRPVKPLDFSFLDHFSMQQAFTLKSLLDHATLTIEEYSDVALLPLDTSLELFESLGNALLIQPADAKYLDAESPFATIEPSRRYRIRPLLIHPIMEFLRGKNILH